MLKRFCDLCGAEIESTGDGEPEHEILIDDRGMCDANLECCNGCIDKVIAAIRPLDKTGILKRLYPLAAAKGGP